MDRFTASLLATFSAAACLALGGCGGDEKDANTGQPPPPQCPPGQFFNGQYCQMGVAGQQGPGQQQPPPPQQQQPPPQQQPQQQQPPGPIATAQQGPAAQPADAASAQAATQLLGPLAKQHAPAGAKPVGPAIAGQFQQGQALEGQIQMQPGKCYTVVAAGVPGTVQNVDLQLVPSMALPGLPQMVMAQDQTAGPTAVIGNKPDCYKWPLQLAAPIKLILTVSQGQGPAAAQVYVK